MSSLPDGYTIRIIYRYGIYNCATILKSKYQDFTCHNSRDGDFNSCCLEHSEGLEFNKCYPQYNQTLNYTSLQLFCQDRQFEGKNLVKISIIIALSVLIFLVLFCFACQKPTKKKDNSAKNIQNMKLLSMNSEYKYNSMYQTF